MRGSRATCSGLVPSTSADLEYRYGDSNPGFRTENCLCEAICGRFVPVASKEISPVERSSVESGTYFGTRFSAPRLLQDTSRMSKEPELLTIDLNIARDFLEPKRAHHQEAVALFELNGSSVELAMGPQGTLVDADGELRQEIVQLLSDQNVGELEQLAYLSEATFPSSSLYPGQLVDGFKDDWMAILKSWKTDKGRPPEYPDDFHVEAHILHGRAVFITRDR